MTPINPTRHLEVFQPETFDQTRIDVIGVGATGSKIALELAKLGVKNLHAWDFDKIESHNIANQAFGINQSDMYKITALKRNLIRDTGLEVVVHKDKADGSQTLGSVVFIAVDTMSSRKQIWKYIKFNPHIQVAIETRMGKDQGRIYTINPLDSEHVRLYEATLYTDDEVSSVSACGASTTVGATATTIAGLAVWQFIKWFNIQNGKSENQLGNEIIITLDPLQSIVNHFG
ncbi:ThiF family adenylyltransferase [Patescibacteria group bacterium]